MQGFSNCLRVVSSDFHEKKRKKRLTKTKGFQGMFFGVFQWENSWLGSPPTNGRLGRGSNPNPKRNRRCFSVYFFVCPKFPDPWSPKKKEVAIFICSVYIVHWVSTILFSDQLVWLCISSCCGATRCFECDTRCSVVTPLKIFSWIQMILPLKMRVMAVGSSP